MTIDVFAEICKNCGYRINNRNGHYFLRKGMINYSFPLNYNIASNKNLTKSLEWKYPLSVILTDLDIKNTSEFILNTNDYGLDKFSRKTRNRIRKSLKNCNFRRPIFEDMLYFGQRINQQTLKKQCRTDRMLTNHKRWRQYLTSIYSNDDIIILGSFNAERMVGYIIVADIEDEYCILHAFIDKQNSELTSPMNGLLFTFINQLIKEKGLIKVSYGIDSIRDLPDLNRFKTNMLFEKVPTTRVFIINPLLSCFLKLLMFILIRVMKLNNFRNRFVRELVHIYYGYRILLKTSQTTGPKHQQTEY